MNKEVWEILLYVILGIILMFISAAQATDYYAVILHPTGAFDSSEGRGISDGQQVGCGGLSSYHALLWSGTAQSLVDLHPSGYDHSYAYGISGGKQVGYGTIIAMNWAQHALMWSGTAESVVELHPNSFENSVAYGISADQQVGKGYNKSNDHNTPIDYRLYPHALLWSGTAESVVDLNPSWCTNSTAYGVSGGHQVGYGDGHALLWSGTAESLVDLHPDGYNYSIAYGIWGSQQVGYGDGHALLWSGTAESVVDLHGYLPAGYDYSTAHGISSAGNIIGFAHPTGIGADYFRAVLWKPAPKNIGVTPSKFDFHYYLGDPNPELRTVSIWAKGVDTINWQIAEDCNWLGVSPASGQSSGEIDEVTLSVDISRLDRGSYTCELTIFDTNAPDYIRYVPVNLIIGSKLFVPNQYPTIQAAIDMAEDYDMVLVADGTYTGPGNRDIDFLGKAITVRSENGPENCIVDSQKKDCAFYFHNSEDASSVLEGFTLTNGYQRGGGIFCVASSPTVNNCIISNNIGCGILCRDSSPVISNCKIVHNWAPDGSGIGCMRGSSPIIRSCVISGNKATQYGGGIRCDGSTLMITNCIITGNSALGGGGIFCAVSSPEITNCIFWGNESPDGPQIYLWKISSALVSYTDLQGDQNDVYISPDSTLDWGKGNIDADPCFIEPGYWDVNDLWVDGDYHLLPDSPCIDAGDPNYIAEPNETDLDGNPRVRGDAIDMGAYETIIHEAHLLILPRVLNRRSSKPRVMAWLHLPEGITKDLIDSDTPLILYPDGIKAIRQFVIPNRRRDAQRVSIFAFFDKAELTDAIPANDRVELQVLGYLRQPGQYYSGSDTIKIKSCR